VMRQQAAGSALGGAGSPPLLARPHEALLGLGHRRRTLHSPAPPKPAVGQGKRSSGPSKRRRRRSQSDSSMEVFQGKSRSLCSAPVPKEKQGIIKCTECRTPCFGIAHARRRRRGVKVDATHGGLRSQQTAGWCLRVTRACTFTPHQWRGRSNAVRSHRAFAAPATLQPARRAAQGQRALAAVGRIACWLGTVSGGGAGRRQTWLAAQ
jgi:hypothetical protein